jgi:hypothetical protein
MTQIGSFNKEDDGRLSGHVLFIGTKRKDGKTPVVHAFGSGKRIKKIYDENQLKEQIEKLTNL